MAVGPRRLDSAPSGLPQLSRGFHGTMSNISNFILPSAQTGAEAAGIALPDKTYFTPLEEEAWGYATGTGRGAGQRPRVYETIPLGQQELDSNHAADRPTVGIGKDLERPQYTEMTAPRTAPSQQIVDTHWTPTPKFHGGWVQGTLPQVNWHQFDAPNWVQYNSQGEAYDDFDQPMSAANEPVASQPESRQKDFTDSPLPGFEDYSPPPAPTNTNSLPL